VLPGIVPVTASHQFGVGSESAGRVGAERDPAQVLAMKYLSRFRFVTPL